MTRSTRMRRVMTAAGLAALALAAGAIAQPSGDDAAKLRVAPPPPRDPQVPFEKYKLDNGLEVILMQDQSAPLAYVSVWYHVGSGHEVPGKSGFAHLFEHMLFQGSKNVGADQHFEILKRIGATTVNGTTNPDRTNYYELVPSNELEAALWLESDRMSHLLETLTEASLKNQIDVVRNERRQNYDNIAYRRTRFTQYAAMYPEGHPYRYLTIGRHEDLMAATLDDVKSFYKTWYVPSNATLLVAGDFDTAPTKELVQKWFGSFPSSTKPEVVKIPAPVVTATEVSYVDTLAKQRQLQYVWHSPANFGPGDAELDIAADALAREGTGRLYRILVHEKQLALSVSASQGGMSFSGLFEITVRLRNDANLEEVRKIVDAELERMRKEPVSDREIARAVTRFESAVVYGMESLPGRAERLMAYNHYLGDPGSLTYDLDRYRNTNADNVRAVVAKYLDEAHRVVVMTLPAEGGAP
jgi:zinc protease